MPLTLFSKVSVSSEAVPLKSLPLRFSTLVALTKLMPLARLTLSLPPPMSRFNPVTLVVRPRKSLPALPTRFSTLTMPIV